MQRNAEIHKYARALKKSKIISSVWTRNCQIFLKKHPIGEKQEGEVHRIMSMDDFVKFGLELNDEDRY